MLKYGVLVGLLSLLLVQAQPHILAQAKIPTLREVATARGLFIGAAAMPNFYDATEPEYPEVLAREFNLIVAENIMKWSAVSNTRGKYSFAAADAMVAFAQKNKMAMRGHTLVWHESLPQYVRGLSDKNLMRNVLRQHVQTVATHFKGKVSAWDVLNEAILEDGSYRKTPFYNVLGEEFIGHLFKWAREADPSAKLFYNDYNTEGLNPKSDAIYTMVKNLLAKGVPIDGVGFQTHIDMNFSVQGVQMQKNLQRFRDLGLEVQLTEVDVQLRGTALQAERLTAQARVYKDLMQICLSVQCTAFVTWGFTDAYSWRSAQQPLLFDSSYQPKPAYFALLEALGSSNPPQSTPQNAAMTTAPLLVFASFANNAIVGDGRVQKTEYAERTGDAVVKNLGILDNFLTLEYQLSTASGSSFAGAGVNITLAKPIDARAYRLMRLQLSSSQAQLLRIRIAGNDEATLQAGCYPVLYQKVTPEPAVYDLPLEKFSAPSYCAAQAKTIAQTLPQLHMVEVADDGLPNSGTRTGQIRLGTIEFR
jgi:endo-1,4-beta-xylanase